MNKLVKEFLSKLPSGDNMLPNGTSPEDAMTLLYYFLCSDFMIMAPVSSYQMNTEVVHRILYKYSKEYRKLFKQKEVSV